MSAVSENPWIKTLARHAPNRGILLAALTAFVLRQPVLAQDVRSRDATAPVPAAAPAQPFGVSYDPGNARYLPPQPQVRPGNYSLGIMARNTPTGVDVVQVNNGSVAQASGLEVGDVVVNVAGYQVGYVGDRLYDLGDEVSRRVNPAGQVPLLIRNQRTGAMVNVPVQFGAASARTISGVLSAEAGAVVPPSAVVTIRLLDVTQPEWTDVALTQGQLPSPVGLPASYRIDLPAVQANHRYAVDARVEEAGRLLLRTPTPVAIASLDRDQRIDLLLSSRGIAAPAPAALPPRDQVQQWIQTYLGRQPYPYEADVWLADLQRGKTMADIQAGILSSTELFERQRSNPDLYSAEVFRLIYGMPPNPAQMNDLRSRWASAQGIRLRFVEGLLRQPR